ncbi:MAG: ATP phosphoribosyltransferase regulatory subunit [Oscillospiraceae bacterium]|nr:ATP phosphoribosyltransferase regulatory subunit [Oscillospiraceae bacterium]
MDLETGILKNEETISLALRALYARYGYVQYRMSRFEEYELYVNNKDFLISSDVITFTDTNGRLMALKPDVTLSIVRASRAEPGTVQKVYYDEAVYRTSPGARGFREIRQVGLECLGAVDDYAIGEVLLLAAESLRRISNESALCVSHLGIADAMLGELGLRGEDRTEALKCIGEKNPHELAALCRARGVSGADTERLTKLAQLYGPPEQLLPELEALGCEAGAVAQLRRLTEMLRAGGIDGGLLLDLSVLGDMRYYNGVAFRGFVRGASAGVLSGGQYDRLLGRMGKKGKAIGFACYLDQLERLCGIGQAYDADVLLLYEEGDAPGAVAAAVRRLVGDGHRVSAQKAVPEKGAFRRIVKLSESGVSGDA